MNTIRSLIFGSVFGASLIAVPTGCTKQQAAEVVTDLQPLEACASNAIADALLLGTADPLAIVAQCGGLTLQALANIVRDMISSPAQPPAVDAGVGFDPRPQLAEAVRQSHLKAILGNLAAQGIVPQAK